MSCQVIALLDPETPELMDAYYSFIDKSNNQNEFTAQELNSPKSRQVYLFIRKPMKVFFPQERVLLLLLEWHFLTTGAPVSHWVFCREMHSNEGIHYHLSSSVLKLCRWDQVESDHRMSVHFSAKSLGYVTAYRYVCKSDKDVLHSADHTDLQSIGTSPIIKKCM